MFYISSKDRTKPVSLNGADHRKKKFKAVVDMSEPISIQVENQTDIDILTKLDLLDDEDTSKVLDFINNLLTTKKYEGIEDSPIDYVTK